jgi:hypothetical protein
MASKTFHFLVVNYDVEQSDKQHWELERSKARRHAAIVGAYRQMERTQEAKSQKSSEQHQLALLMKSPLDKSSGLLDPFVALSMRLSIGERNLLHGCRRKCTSQFDAFC